MYRVHTWVVPGAYSPLSLYMFSQKYLGHAVLLTCLVCSAFCCSCVCTFSELSVSCFQRPFCLSFVFVGSFFLFPMGKVLYPRGSLNSESSCLAPEKLQMCSFSLSAHLELTAVPSHIESLRERHRPFLPAAHLTLFKSDLHNTLCFRFESTGGGG